MSSLSERLKALRKAKSAQRGTLVTCEEIAEAVGVSSSSMYMYERGERRPLSDTLERLADYYGVTTDHLLGRPAQTNGTPDTHIRGWGTPVPGFEKLPKHEQERIERRMQRIRELEIQEAVREMEEASRGEEQQ